MVIYMLSLWLLHEDTRFYCNILNFKLVFFSFNVIRQRVDRRGQQYTKSDRNGDPCTQKEKEKSQLGGRLAAQTVLLLRIGRNRARYVVRLHLKFQRLSIIHVNIFVILKWFYLWFCSVFTKLVYFSIWNSRKSPISWCFFKCELANTKTEQVWTFLVLTPVSTK